MTTWYNTTSSGYIGTSASALTTLSTIPTNSIVYYTDIELDNKLSGNIKVDHNSKLELPDGTIIDLDNSGNFEIIDKDAKIIYKANRTREFNKFINASDLLENFIKDLGKVNIRQGEVLNIPIEMFINWIIHKSAEQDGDSVPNNIPALNNNKYKHPKCKCCGRFIKKELVSKGLNFCNGNHYQKYIERLNGS